MNSLGKIRHVKKFLGVVLIVTGPMLLNGCIAAIAVIAIVGSSKDGYTATVEVEETPDAVYAAMLRVVDERPNVELIKRDDEQRLVEASEGKNKAVGVAELQDNGMTKLTITATAGETDMECKELALQLVETVCKDLGVPYRVVEEDEKKD